MKYLVAFIICVSVTNIVSKTFAADGLSSVPASNSLVAQGGGTCNITCTSQGHSCRVNCNATDHDCVMNCIKEEQACHKNCH